MRRYANFSSNLNALQKAYGEDLSNDFIVSGIIDKFALQFELSWKLLKEALTYEVMQHGGFEVAEREREQRLVEKPQLEYVA